MMLIWLIQNLLNLINLKFVNDEFILEFEHLYNKIKEHDIVLTFISISISIYFLKIKPQMFERNGCTITVHNDLYYNELKI